MRKRHLSLLSTQTLSLRNGQMEHGAHVVLSDELSGRRVLNQTVASGESQRRPMTQPLLRQASSQCQSSGVSKDNLVQDKLSSP